MACAEHTILHHGLTECCASCQNSPGASFDGPREVGGRIGRNTQALALKREALDVQRPLLDAGGCDMMANKCFRTTKGLLYCLCAGRDAVMRVSCFFFFLFLFLLPSFSESIKLGVDVAQVLQLHRQHRQVTATSPRGRECEEGKRIKNVVAP